MNRPCAVAKLRFLTYFDTALWYPFDPFNSIPQPEGEMAYGCSAFRLMFGRARGSKFRLRGAR
jgi:hypothetical protein